MNRRTPGLPVHHQLPESTQTYVHWVGNAIQPSHPLSSPSPPALNLTQHQGLFQWVSSLHQVAKVLEFQLQHQSFQWTPRTDLLKDGLVRSPCSPRDSQESSPIPQFKSINSFELSFLYRRDTACFMEETQRDDLSFPAMQGDSKETTLCKPHRRTSHQLAPWFWISQPPNLCK